MLETAEVPPAFRMNSQRLANYSQLSYAAICVSLLVRYQLCVYDCDVNSK